MPSCELCGRTMKGRGRNITIEGASLLVCPQCAAKFGGQREFPQPPGRSSAPTRTSWTERPTTSRGTTARPIPPPVRKKKKPVRSRPITLEDMILVEDYADRIRKARQKAGMSQEELAQRIGERISTLQAIEAGRLKPTRKAIRGLERELQISLLEPIGPAPITPVRDRSGSREPTLGDVVRIKRRKPRKDE